MKLQSLLASLFLILCVSATAVAGVNQQIQQEQDGFLDPSPMLQIYPDLVKPSAGRELGAVDLQRALRNLSTEDVIALQSSVKSQGKRGTCSIFSATALLESMLIINGHDSTIDLSEEWLEYVIMRNRTSEGSSSPANFNVFRRWGSTTEERLPYDIFTWTEEDMTDLGTERCGTLTSTRLTSCLLGHWDPQLFNNPRLETLDPELFEAKRQAANNRDRFMQFDSNIRYSIGFVQDIKQLLKGGTPITMGITFFYGAWNHRLAESKLGLTRNEEHWAQGIVGYPERGSKDRELSRGEDVAAGHSIVIVGYDNNIVVETKVEMSNGDTVTKTHTGVYYFKNSWGTDSFGVDFALNGNPYAGYGMITQDYAHEFGSFYRMPLLK